MPINLETKSILREFEIRNFCETGIFKGDTITLVHSWFDELYPDGNYQIIEVDIDEEAAKIGETLLLGVPSKVFCSDSATMLKENIEDAKLFGNRTLFFLDAHWREYWPLRDEITAILKLKNKPIIAIDDFHNPLIDFHLGHIGTHDIKDIIGDRCKKIWHAREVRPHDPIGCCFLFIDEDENVVREKMKNLKFDEVDL